MRDTVDFSKLVENAKNGDESAFRELYSATLRTAYHTASLMLKNPDDVEDVLQNVYMKAAKNLSELKNPGSFESWLKTIVENESKNYIKKEKRFQVPALFFRNKPQDAEEWKQPVPQEFMEREELREQVTKILDGLSPEVRACIVLFHYEDKSLSEISEILEIPLGTVKSRLHNGRKQIEKEFRKLLKKDPTLYGIGAIPLVLSLMAYQAQNVTVPAALSEGIASAAATAATTASAAATSASAGVSVSATAAGASTAVSAGAGTAAATTIAVKVAAVAVAGSVAVGGTAAIKTQVDKNRANETSTAYISTVKTEETCTVAESLTQATTLQELSTVLTTVISTAVTSAPSTKNAVTSTENETEKTTAEASIEVKTTKKSRTTTRRPSTTATTKPTTTKKLTTTKKPTTTGATTEEVTTEETTEETTTRKATTTRKPTTTRKETTTQKPTTTLPPTTSPENNYGMSGGIITEYTGSESSVSIPSSIDSQTVTAIGAGAFSGNEDIKSVTLPSTVTQIGQEAFSDCTSLSSVSLPSSLKQIGMGAFYGCTSLSSVTVPSGTTTISDEAFAYCTSLSTVTIPSSVTSIADDAFTGCDSLTIRCEEGSAAHDFAVANSIDYVLT